MQGGVEYKPVCSGKMNEYTGDGKVSFGINEPSTILNLKIMPGFSYRLLYENFIACNEGIKITISDTDDFFTLHNVSNEVKYIWGGALGKHQKIVLQQDDNITLRKNILLIYDTQLNFIEEGEYLKISGPCSFYIQTNYKDNESSKKGSLWNILNSSYKQDKLRDRLRKI